MEHEAWFTMNTTETNTNTTQKTESIQNEKNTILIKNNEEYQYIDLIQKILQAGDKREGRNGITYSIFGTQMRFSLKNGVIPFITSKRLAWKTCLKELLWFIKGDTDNRNLKKENVRIWNGNGSKEFLESRELDYEEDDLGPVYGFQWRNFNGSYRSRDDYDSSGIDQLKEIIMSLKGDPQAKEGKYSRRLILTAWNPCQIDKMALPPCHMFCQFYVNSKDELSCSMYQRSGDVGLGVPFNIASYSFLTHLLAHHCGLKPGEFIHTIGDTHIYDDHIEPLKEQITREPYMFPSLNIIYVRENIEDYVVDDFQISNYVYHKKVEMKMRV
jgi:thymidylate synthase